MSSRTEPGERRHEVVANLNTRLDRLPVFGISPVVFAVVGAAYFFTFYDITAMGATLPTLEDQFHLSGSDLALPVTTNLFTYIVGAYVLSSVADYIGRRRALVIAFSVMSLGSILTAFSWNVGSLAAFRGLTGLGMGAEISLAAAIMTELSPSAMRGRGVALNVFWGSVGLAIAPWLGLGLIDWLPSQAGWRVVFGIGCLAILLIPFLNDRLVPESPRWLVLHGQEDRAYALMERMESRVSDRGFELLPAKPAPAEANLDTFPTVELLRPPYLSRVAIVVGYWFFMYLADYAYLTYLATLLDKMGVSNNLLFNAIGDLGLVLGGLLTIFVIDRFDRKHTIVGACVIGIVGLGIIALSSGRSELIVLGALLAGVWIMIASSAGYTYTSEIFPTRARASGMALGDGIGHLGGAVQPYVVVASLAAFSALGTFEVIMGSLAIATLVIGVGGISTSGDRLTELSQ